MKGCKDFEESSGPAPCAEAGPDKPTPSHQWPQCLSALKFRREPYEMNTSATSKAGRGSTDNVNEPSVPICLADG